MNEYLFLGTCLAISTGIYAKIHYDAKNWLKDFKELNNVSSLGEYRQRLIQQRNEDLTSRL